MADLKTGTTIGGQTAWHAGNDGSGSGLDADTLDGLNADQLGVSQVASSAPTVRGQGDLWTASAPIAASTGVAAFDDNWILMTPLVNGWYNYGGQYEPARFRKTIDGLLIMGGLIRSSSSWGKTCFTLPVGYRPQYNQLMAALNDNWINRLNIYPDGQIIPEQQTSGSDWASLRVVIWVG